MKFMNFVVTLGTVVLATAGCRKGPSTAPRYGASDPGAFQIAASRASSVKGAGGEMPAFYDGRRITINSVELSATAENRVGSNPSHNEIFVTNDLDDPQDFFPVIDAIQGDGFNPLWHQIRCSVVGAK